MPTPLTDADKVLRNDTGLTIATNIASIATALGTSNTLDGLDDVTINSGTLTGNQALVYDAVAGQWVNSNLIVPDELNDLSDVSINTPLNRQELVYNDALEVFQNKTTRVELTMAEYNQLVADDHVLPNVDYYITDAPSMTGTAQELSYDGSTTSVYDKVEGLTAGDIALGSTAPSGSTAEAISNKTFIDQKAGNSLTLVSPIVFGFYYADQWFAYVPLPFIAKNANYSITFSVVTAANVGDITSKISITSKANTYFRIVTTRDMPSFPSNYSCNLGLCTFVITFA